MEIPAWWFFSFWALIGITFLHLGFYAFDKTDLSNSVSPVVMSLFKHSLAISCCHSTSYALILRPRSKLSLRFRYLWLYYGVIPDAFCNANNNKFSGCFSWHVLQFLAWLFRFPELRSFADECEAVLVFMFFHSAFLPWAFPVWTFINFFLIPDGGLTREQKAGIRIHMAVESSLFLVRGSSTKFFPGLVFLTSILTSAVWAAVSGVGPLTRVSRDPLSGDVRFQNLLSLAGKRLTDAFWVLKEKRTGKLIEFAVGIGGSILFQKFFRLTSFSHVAPFLCLAVAWVANLALLGVSGDFGVLNFLLGNVIVGCTVSQFGLGGTTWLAYGASLLLFGLRLKLESLTFVDRGGGQAQVVLAIMEREGEAAQVVLPIVDRGGEQARVLLW